jgi:ribosomal protein S11
LTLLQISFTKNNIYLTLRNHNKQLTRSLGVYNIVNAFKHFPSAFELMLEGFLRDLQKLELTQPLDVVFKGTRTQARPRLIDTLTKNGYQIKSIADHTMWAFNGCRQKKRRR